MSYFKDRIEQLILKFPRHLTNLNPSLALCLISLSPLVFVRANLTCFLPNVFQSTPESRFVKAFTYCLFVFRVPHIFLISFTKLWNLYTWSSYLTGLRWKVGGEFNVNICGFVPELSLFACGDCMFYVSRKSSSPEDSFSFCSPKIWRWCNVSQSRVYSAFLQTLIDRKTNSFCAC